MQFFQFLLIGFGTGGIYAVIALGLVLVFRGSGTVNFAHGGIAMVGAYAFYELNVNHNWPWGLAMAAAVVLAMVVGFLTYVLVMRPLRRASGLAGLIATLGVLIILQSIATLRYGTSPIIVPSFLSTNPVDVAGVNVGQDTLIIFAISVVLTAVLWAGYRFTRFGITTAAVSENSDIVASLGTSPHRVAAINWTLGAGLAGLAGVLLVPSQGLESTSFALVVIPALGAALIGNLSSFPLTLVGGLLIGVVQSEIGNYASGVTGLADSVPFILIILTLAIRGKGLPLRSEIRERLPRVGSGKINVRSAVPALLLAGLVIWALPLNWQNAAASTLLTAIIVSSFVVVTGFAGQLSLAQYAFAGFAALIAGRVAENHGLPFLLAIAVGVAATIPIGFLVGLPALRTRGVSLGIATLGLGVAIEALVFDNNNYVGGVFGINVGSPEIFGISLNVVRYPFRYALLSLIAFALCLLMISNLRRGRSGRRMLAVRSNERAAASLGIGVATTKLAAFVLASAIAAFGGVLLAFRTPTILLDQFGGFASVGALANAVIGGIGHAGGALIGGAIAGGLGGQVLDSINSGWDRYISVISGASLIFIIIRYPDGVMRALIEGYHRSASILRQRLERRKTDEQGDSPASGQASSERGKVGTRSYVVKPARTPLADSRTELSVDALSIHFGNVAAVSEVSFQLRSGEVLGVVGPNGAGKTTLIDALTGYVPMRQGRIKLDDVDIGRWPVVRRARNGVRRSFQSLELFEDLTVLENICAADDHQDMKAFLTDLVRPGRLVLSSDTMDLIESLGLTSVLHEYPPALSYGQRRLIAIARALASNPSVLLLDEPAAGLDEHERAEVGEIVRRLSRERQVAVLLIEHDVELVRKISDRLIVLDFGKVIGAGLPEEVLSEPQVIQAYLGIAEDDGIAEPEVIGS